MFGKKERDEQKRVQAEQRRIQAESEAKAALDAHKAELELFLEAAREFRGFDKAEAQKSPVLLKGDERVFALIEGICLVEPRASGGHWEGRSQGVSVHVPGTKSMRYRVGQTKGQYVQSSPKLTVIDEGSAVVTDKRVVFTGPKYTREWLWSKCVALDHQDDLPYTVIGVSNRQKSSGVAYDDKIAPMVRFRLDLALAVANGTTEDLIRELSTALAQQHTSNAWPAPALPPG